MKMGAGYASRPAYIRIQFVGTLSGHHQFDIVGLVNPNISGVYVAGRIELVRCESSCAAGSVPVTNLKDVWYERYQFYFGAKVAIFTTETTASSPTGQAIQTPIPSVDILAQHSDAPTLEQDYDYMLFTYPVEMYASGIVIKDSAANTIEMIHLAPGSIWLYPNNANIAINSGSSKFVMENARSPKGDGVGYAAATTITYVKENIVWAKTNFTFTSTYTMMSFLSVGCTGANPRKNKKSVHACSFTPDAVIDQTGIIKITATNVTKLHCPALETTTVLGLFSCAQDPTAPLEIYFYNFGGDLAKNAPFTVELTMSFSLVTGATISAEAWNAYTGTPPAQTPTAGTQVLNTAAPYTFPTYETVIALDYLEAYPYTSQQRVQQDEYGPMLLNFSPDQTWAKNASWIRITVAAFWPETTTQDFYCYFYHWQTHTYLAPSVCEKSGTSFDVGTPRNTD